MSGDIDSNPASHKVWVKKSILRPGPINFGSFNIRSVILRSAIIHDLIKNEQLDILALYGTWTDLAASNEGLESHVAPVPVMARSVKLSWYDLKDRIIDAVERVHPAKLNQFVC